MFHLPFYLRLLLEQRKSLNALVSAIAPGTDLNGDYNQNCIAFNLVCKRLIEHNLCPIFQITPNKLSHD